MDTSKASKAQRKQHPFGLLHRYGGITGAVLVILVCVTGLLLNHTDELGLSKKTVGAEGLLDWYGIETPSISSFGYGEQYVSQLKRSLYLNDTQIPGTYSPVQGIVVTQMMTVIATDQEIILTTQDGKLIEIMTKLQNIPSDIHQIGILPDSRIVIRTADTLWLADPQFIGWTAADLTGLKVEWSAITQLPDELAQSITAHYRGTGLSLERILLDLHSGRILGRGGVWLGDAVAILFILLAMTGIWLWFKSRQ